MLRKTKEDKKERLLEILDVLSHRRCVFGRPAKALWQAATLDLLSSADTLRPKDLLTWSRIERDSGSSSTPRRGAATQGRVTLKPRWGQISAVLARKEDRILPPAPPTESGALPGRQLLAGGPGRLGTPLGRSAPHLGRVRKLILHLSTSSLLHYPSSQI